MSASDPKRTSARPCRAVTVLGGCRENFDRAGLNLEETGDLSPPKCPLMTQSGHWT